MRDDRRSLCRGKLRTGNSRAVCPTRADLLAFSLADYYSSCGSLANYPLTDYSASDDGSVTDYSLAGYSSWLRWPTTLVPDVTCAWRKPTL